jgi:hypothetical protein
MLRRADEVRSLWCCGSTNKRRILWFCIAFYHGNALTVQYVERCGTLPNKLETRAAKEMIMRSLNGGGPCGAQSFDANAMKRG